MAEAFRSVGVSPGADGTSCVIVKPVGLTIGDLMEAQVVGINSEGGIGTFTSPANWTSIRQDDWIADSDHFFASALFWKIADSDDVATTNFTFVATNVESNRGAITAWKTGTFDVDTPINASNGQQNNDFLITAPTITPSVANCEILIICAVGNNNTQGGYGITISNPETWVEAYDLPSNLTRNLGLSMAYATRPETSATGNGGAESSASDPNIGQLVAIAPAAAVPTRPYTPHCGPRKKRTQFFPTLKLGG